ncbi:hypothetical protein A5662_23655 [Mycobacteriaceae bacterium 1482268.1]|nr:hypothetical protein A5662_23655 [Mycobacteriaceae bacterium 1482268.1]
MPELRVRIQHAVDALAGVVTTTTSVSVLVWAVTDPGATGAMLLAPGPGSMVSEAGSSGLGAEVALTGRHPPVHRVSDMALAAPARSRVASTASMKQAILWRWAFRAA